ncbi:MAG: C4-dicarboxylate ABC transporter [Desulfobacterales bacterium]|nr:MAG: C4-dicarboxylate ABC transporter [Desulfobacterales bacterium]
MFTKKRTIYTTVLLIQLLLVGYAAGAPVVIRFSHVSSENSPTGQMALKFKELVAKHLADRFVVEVYPDSQFFNDDQSFEALLMDDIQMAVPSVSKFNKYNKRLQLFDLPFLFKDIESARRFQQSLEGNYLLFNFFERGILGLAYMNSGFKQISATTKLLTPEDASGLSFRIMSSDVLKDQFNALGAEAVAKPFFQVFSLLSTGAVDGQENCWSNMYSKKLYTAQPYITETNHGLLSSVIVTSTNFWESLTAADQGDLKAALNEAVAFGEKLAVEAEKNDRQKIIDSQLTEVITLTPEQRKRWVEAMKPVWKKYEKEIGQDLIDYALQANQ